MKASVIEEVQNEANRIREMIAETKVLLPIGRANFAVYEATLNEADRAVRERDTVALIRVLSELRNM